MPFPSDIAELHRSILRWWTEHGDEQACARVGRHDVCENAPGFDLASLVLECAPLLALRFLSEQSQPWLDGVHHLEKHFEKVDLSLHAAQSREQVNRLYQEAAHRHKRLGAMIHLTRLLGHACSRVLSQAGGQVLSTDLGRVQLLVAALQQQQVRGQALCALASATIREEKTAWARLDRQLDELAFFLPPARNGRWAWWQSRRSDKGGETLLRLHRDLPFRARLTGRSRVPRHMQKTLDALAETKKWRQYGQDVEALVRRGSLLGLSCQASRLSDRRIPAPAVFLCHFAMGRYWHWPIRARARLVALLVQWLDIVNAAACPQHRAQRFAEWGLGEAAMHRALVHAQDHSDLSNSLLRCLGMNVLPQDRAA